MDPSAPAVEGVPRMSGILQSSRQKAELRKGKRELEAAKTETERDLRHRRMEKERKLAEREKNVSEREKRVKQAEKDIIKERERLRILKNQLEKAGEPTKDELPKAMDGDEKGPADDFDEDDIGEYGDSPIPSARLDETK